MSKVTIIGATTWGNTLGRLLADKGAMVSVWARTEAKADELRQEHQESLSRGVSTSELSFTGNLDEALCTAEFVICAVPAQRMRQNMRLSNPHLSASMILISVAKGLEAETGKRMSEVITDEAACVSQDRICVLSGPNLSGEINQGLPATSVVAGRDMMLTERCRGCWIHRISSFLFAVTLLGLSCAGPLRM